MKSNIPEIVADIFDNGSHIYVEKYMNVNLYKNSLDALCAVINSSTASILDIGCGPGNIAKYLLDQHSEFTIKGIDISPKMIAIAKANNPNADFEVMDCRLINMLKESYNAIVCGFCLPYLSKEETKELIVNISNLLTPDGYLYLSTMEDAYENSTLKSASYDVNKKLYIYYHESDYLIACLTENHFKIIYKEQFVNPENTSKNDLILIAQLNA